MRIIKRCCEALDDKKAEGIKVLHVHDQSSITDYFILATGNSEPHLRALTNTLSSLFKEEGVPVLGTETNASSGWSVIDAFDIIVHVFLPDMRDFYRIDSLWKDAEEVPLDSFLYSKSVSD
ncbi:MAG: ribosome silencing factor [Opitutales bacterium]